MVYKADRLNQCMHFIQTNTVRDIRRRKSIHTLIQTTRKLVAAEDTKVMFCQLKMCRLSWTQPQVWWSSWGVSLTEVAVAVKLFGVRQSSVLTRPSSELLQPAVTEDFAHLPPEQRRKRLQQKLEEICKELQKEVDQRCVCVCVYVGIVLLINN